MHVIYAVAEFYFVHVGNIGEILVLGGSRNRGVAVFEGLFIGLGRKIARKHVIGLAVHHKVERNGRELLGSAALHEKHGVIVGNREKFAEQALRFVVHRHKGLGTVAHFRDRHARTVKIEQIFLRFF